MRRLFRWLINASALLALATCLAITCLWVRSYSVEDVFTFQRRRPDRTNDAYLQVWSAHGLLNGTAGPAADLRGGRWTVMFGPRRQWAWGTNDLTPQGQASAGVPSPFSRTAFCFERLDRIMWVSFGPTNTPPTPPSKLLHFSFPDWALVAPLGLWPLALGATRLVRWRRSSRRAARGLCSNCGYDLRCSTGRCPECGAAPSRSTDLGGPPTKGMRSRRLHFVSRRLAFVATACVGLLLAAGGLAVRERNARRVRDQWQAWANATPWVWHGEEVSVADEVPQAPADFRIEREWQPGHYLSPMSLHVTSAGREPYEVPAQGYVQFARAGGVLVYTDRPTGDCGCTLVAIDLKSGEELWRNNLLAVGDHDHSIYGNTVRLELLRDAVRVWGDESAGRYVEVIDLRTGRTLAHRDFGQPFDP